MTLSVECLPTGLYGRILSIVWIDPHFNSMNCFPLGPSSPTVWGFPITHHRPHVAQIFRVNPLGLYQKKMIEFNWIATTLHLYYRLGELPTFLLIHLYLLVACIFVAGPVLVEDWGRVAHLFSSIYMSGSMRRLMTVHSRCDDVRLSFPPFDFQIYSYIIIAFSAFNNIRTFTLAAAVVEA